MAKKQRNMVAPENRVTTKKAAKEAKAPEATAEPKAPKAPKVGVPPDHILNKKYGLYFKKVKTELMDDFTDPDQAAARVVEALKAILAENGAPRFVNLKNASRLTGRAFTLGYTKLLSDKKLILASGGGLDMEFVFSNESNKPVAKPKDKEAVAS